VAQASLLNLGVPHARFVSVGLLAGGPPSEWFHDLIFWVPHSSRCWRRVRLWSWFSAHSHGFRVWVAHAWVLKLVKAGQST
jgi:hypothetical protein